MKVVFRDDYFAIDKNGKEIGFLKYGIVEELLYINGIVVKEEFRGQGLAKELLDACVDMAKEKDLKIIPRCSYAAKAFDRGGYEAVDGR